MIGEPARCDVCGRRDIPPAAWFWFLDGKPVHPWCDHEVWDQINGIARALVEQLAEMCRTDPRRAIDMSMAGSGEYAHGVKYRPRELADSLRELLR